jgi:hypothetical protein
VVVVDILGVVKLVPVPKLDPTLDTSYQLMVPELAVAPKLTVPASHRDAGVVVAIVGVVVTVATTAVLVAVVQLPFVAST